MNPARCDGATTTEELPVTVISARWTREQCAVTASCKPWLHPSGMRRFVAGWACPWGCRTCCVCGPYLAHPRSKRQHHEAGHFSDISGARFVPDIKSLPGLDSLARGSGGAGSEIPAESISRARQTLITRRCCEKGALLAAVRRNAPSGPSSLAHDRSWIQNCPRSVPTGPMATANDADACSTRAGSEGTNPWEWSTSA